MRVYVDIFINGEWSTVCNNVPALLVTDYSTAGVQKITIRDTTYVGFPYRIIRTEKEES